MKEKDIALFNTAIHQIKDIMLFLTKEREDYHRQIEILTKGHDSKINNLIKRAKEVLDELYTLYDDLSNKEGK